jgi:hypothetical protein
MIRVRAWLAAVVVGLTVGAGTHIWLVDGPLFVGLLATVYVVGTRVFVEYASELPALETDGWQATRWSSGFTGFVSLVSVLTVSLVPVGSFGFRVAVLLLATGMAWTGLFFGVAMTQAMADGDKSIDETDREGESRSREYNSVGTDGVDA